jgi:hypothetical protein
MEFLYFLGGLIALLLGTDTATKGVSGALQQAGVAPLRAGLVLVVVGYALPGLAVVVGALVWHGEAVAASAAHGAMLGTLGLGAAGLLLSTGLVLRVRPWKMLGDDKARAELGEFAASTPGWGRNLFRLALGAALLILGARGLLAGAPFFASLLEAAAGFGTSAADLPSTALSVALGVGATAAVVASFNARFGDAAAAFAAILGGGALLIVAATLLALLVAMPVADLTLLANPLLQGVVALGALAALAKAAKPIGQAAGLAMLAITLALLGATTALAAAA